MGFASLLLAAAAAAPFSIQVGKAATDLETHTGVWEAKVAPNVIVGLSLQVIAQAPFGTLDLHQTPQNVKSINVETYLRRNGATNVNGTAATPAPQVIYSPYRAGSTVTWWNSDMPGNFAVRNGRLHFIETKPFAVLLDLVYDDAVRDWHGKYATPYYSGAVTLVRPRMDVPDTPAGTWIQSADRSFDFAKNEEREIQCLNLGLGEDGQLVLWGEYARVNAAVPRVAEAGAFDESYGETLSDTLTTHAGDRWSFLFANGMWSERITGSLSDGGTRFAGEATDHQGNGFVLTGNPPQPFVWKRAAGDSCL